MEERRIEIAASDVRSLHWHGDLLVDWASGGIRYALDGRERGHWGTPKYRCDSAVVSPSGDFVVLYEKLGTKALVLAGNHVIRELNRSYYYAEAYEFPLAVFRVADGREVIAHCPNSYNRIEIDDLVTGRRLTRPGGPELSDFFHSRLAANEAGTMLLSAGWIWHPLESL